VVLINEDACLPFKGSAKSAGLDLTSCEFVNIKKGQRKLVNTGLQMQFPKNTYGRIAPRSGMALKSSIDIGAGVIDPDYR
jgi:dUTP pyrophosphatase